MPRLLGPCTRQHAYHVSGSGGGAGGHGHQSPVTRSPASTRSQPRGLAQLRLSCREKSVCLTFSLLTSASLQLPHWRRVTQRTELVRAVSTCWWRCDCSLCSLRRSGQGSLHCRTEDVPRHPARCCCWRAGERAPTHLTPPGTAAQCAHQRPGIRHGKSGGGGRRLGEGGGRNQFNYVDTETVNINTFSSPSHADMFNDHYRGLVCTESPAQAGRVCGAECGGSGAHWALGRHYATTSTSTTSHMGRVRGQGLATLPR